MSHLASNPWVWGGLVAFVYYGCALVGLWRARKGSKAITPENNPTSWS
jgi:hypothetical protein